MGTKLYVGNLNYNTSEESLRVAFSANGREVASVSIIMDRETGRSRGFAFVEMTTAEGAQEAMRELDGTDLDGRTLRINEARERERGAPRPGGYGGGPPRGPRPGGFGGGYGDRGAAPGGGYGGGGGGYPGGGGGGFPGGGGGFGPPRPPADAGGGDRRGTGRKKEKERGRDDDDRGGRRGGGGRKRGGEDDGW